MTKNTWWLPDVRQDRIILSVLKHSQVYRPNLRPKSDADILRDAKLEAMGLPPQDESPRRTNHDRHQTATDEIVRSILTCVILKNRLFLSSFRSWNASRNGCGSENHLSSRRAKWRCLSCRVSLVGKIRITISTEIWTHHIRPSGFGTSDMVQ